MSFWLEIQLYIKQNNGTNESFYLNEYWILYEWDNYILYTITHVENNCKTND